MNFSDSISLYVQHKNTMGVEFETGKKYLLAFSRHLGDADLDTVKSEDLLNFLDDSRGKNATWRMKYAVIVSFLDFWASREEIPYLSFPSPKPRVRQEFIPYIYSRAQVRALARIKNWPFGTSLDPMTMRTFILFLYATGVVIGEAKALSIEDLDLKRRMIWIRSKSVIRLRQIPISEDLCKILHRYLAWRNKQNAQGSCLFIDNNGDPVKYNVLEKCFRRHRNLLDISRERSATYQPRLHDLKYTFAVHRITSWIRSGPALAAYMGMKLVSTE
jgi:integrase/recombinase XerD